MTQIDSSVQAQSHEGGLQKVTPEGIPKNLARTFNSCSICGILETGIRNEPREIAETGDSPGEGEKEES
jgi:hypothetical protein